MANITKIFNSSITTGTTKHLFHTPKHRTIIKSVSPHPSIRCGVFLQVDNLPRKKDYREPIQIMRSLGIAMSTIAEVCGISTSYSYKLNRRK